MLVCLRIRNFAIIDALEVELGPGLNVVTGETGAGKSILVDALELVLGGRSNPDSVRTGEKAAEVEAVFDVGTDEAQRGRLEAAGIELDEGELVIRRVVPASGRSRAYVNGRLVTTGELAGIAGSLADISSQHEHHRLTDPASHLDYLDAFAGLLGERARMAEAHARARESRERAAGLVARIRERAEREDLLRFQLEEIDALAPVPGESVELVVARDRLRHATKLARTTGGVGDALYTGDDALTESLGKVAAELRSVTSIDPVLAPLADRIDDAIAALEDVGKELGRYARGVEVDPERLAEVEERLERLRRLERKHGGSVDEILAFRERARAELASLAGAEGALADAEAEATAALAEAGRLALALHEARRKHAKKLAKAIGDELTSLGMGEARIEVSVTSLEGRGDELVIEGGKLTATGLDHVEFLIAPNRGEDARPLRRIASGGELSRSLLAVKRVLAGHGPLGLYVFDEVDTGVGGAVADTIGQKVLEVAKHHQVVCVTHLPQIAAYGTQHFHVHKRVVGGRTRSEIVALEDEARVLELARMLGGAEVTDTARAAARELLERARGGKVARRRGANAA